MIGRRFFAGGLLIVIALAGIGCRGSSTIRSETAVDWQAIQQTAAFRQEHVRTLSGRGRLSIETPEIAQSGSFTLALSRPDSLVLRIEGPFGIKVGALQIMHDSVRFYSSFENRLYIGSANPHNLRRMLRFDATVESLVDLLTGGGFMREDRKAPDSIALADDEIVLDYSAPEGPRQYRADAGTLAIRAIHLLDGNGQPLIEQTFSDHRTLDGMEIPYTLRTVRPQERQMLVLRYRDLIINEPVDLRFDVPRSAEIVRWR